MSGPKDLRDPVVGGVRTGFPRAPPDDLDGGRGVMAPKDPRSGKGKGREGRSSHTPEEQKADVQQLLDRPTLDETSDGVRVRCG